MFDWYELVHGDPCDGLEFIAVGDCEIMPGREYTVQAVWEISNINDEASYSALLVLPAAAVYGDAVGGGSPSQPPDGFANFLDIFAAVSAFARDGNTPNTWVEVDWFNTPHISISFADVQAFVQAFQLVPYSGPEPWDCP